MASAIHTFPATFGRFTVSSVGQGQTAIQNVANIMWLPMLLMGAMSIAAAVILGIFGANSSSDRGGGLNALSKANAETLNTLSRAFVFLGEAMLLAGISFLLATILGALRKGGGEVQEAVTSSVKTLRMPWSAWVFLGLMMMGVMAAIVSFSFAIARILGVFRVGGGLVQDAVGKGIKTPKMPLTAKVFLGGMMMAMMILIFAFAGHIYAAVQANDAWTNAVGLGGADLSALGRNETWGTWLEGLRRIGVGMFLGSIALGLYTIMSIIRFQTLRIRELSTT